MISRLLIPLSKRVSNESVHQIGRYILVGILSVIMEFGILIFLVEYQQWPYLQANIIAFVITNIFNYLLSRHWVFAPGVRGRISEFLIFMTFVSIALGINQFFLWLFVESFNVNYKIAKSIAIGMTIIWNFLTRKHLIFKKHKLNS